MTMDGCERRQTQPFVVRFMTTAQSSRGWRKPTLRFIVKFQDINPYDWPWAYVMPTSSICRSDIHAVLNALPRVTFSRFDFCTGTWTGRLELTVFFSNQERRPACWWIWWSKHQVNTFKNAHKIDGVNITSRWSALLFHLWWVSCLVFIVV